jgi:hypothetical protein
VLACLTVIKLPLALAHSRLETRTSLASPLMPAARECQRWRRATPLRPVRGSCESCRLRPRLAAGIGNSLAGVCKRWGLWRALLPCSRCRLESNICVSNACPGYLSPRSHAAGRGARDAPKRRSAQHVRGKRRRHMHRWPGGEASWRAEPASTNSPALSASGPSVGCGPQKEIVPKTPGHPEGGQPVLCNHRTPRSIKPGLQPACRRGQKPGA